MQDMFRLMADNMIFPIWIKDKNMKFVYVNKMFANLYNKKIEEFIGLKVEEVFEEKLWKKFNEHCIEVIESGEVITKEMYNGNKYSQCSVIPLKNEEEEIIAIAGIVGVITDIGRLKEKEYEIEKQKSLTKQIMDILPGSVFYKDIEGKYIYANKSCKDFYEDKGIDSIIGKTDLDINPNKLQAEKFTRDDKVIIQTKEPIINEAIFVQEDNKTMYSEAVKMPVLDSEGNVMGIVGRAIDITEKKLAQERLEYLSYTDILTGAKNRTCFEEKQKLFSNEKYFPLGVIMGDANGLKLVNDTLGHNRGDELLKEITNVLMEVCHNNGEVFRFGGDEFAILIPNSSLKFCEEVILEIVEKCKNCKNDLFNVSISLGAAIKDNTDQDIYEVLKEAEDKVYRQKLLQKRSLKTSILNSLKIGLGVRSGETEEHTRRVAVSAVKVGAALRLEMAKIEELRIAADLHDIGKVGISEEILLKVDTLTNSEYEVMKTHVEKGYRIIKASSELKGVAESVLYHHERWDGKGYPMGLRGEEIPLISRIISVCDAYDVMTNDRIYKKGVSKEMAIEELRRCSGKQFDPNIVEVFINYNLGR